MSETQIVWGAASLVVTCVVAPYFVSFRRRRHSDRARKAEAARLGIDRPVAQFPYVDATRCIGCGTCVNACPEGDVLGVVGGTATVINGLKCVGHGHCEKACPVGAIEVGLGDVKSRKDVPLTDKWHESSVPGMFVVGELGGLALVRNAVSQGQRAVDRIVRRAGAQRRSCDVVIVGAGPAGLAAAAAARQRGLRALVLEQEASLGGTILHYPRRKLVLVQDLELPFLGRLREGEYSKELLIERLEGLVREARLDVRFGQKVEEVIHDEDLFRVRTTQGIAAAPYVVLAAGRRGSPRKLGVPGEQQSKVLYRLQDAESYRGLDLLVVGGGDSAAEAAIGLARQPGNRVTLSYRREKLVRIKHKNEERIGALLKSGRLRALFSSEVTEILSDRVRLKVEARQVELKNAYVFVFAGGDPPFELLRRVGVRFGGEATARPQAPAARASAL